jgi:hypothetical protein
VPCRPRGLCHSPPLGARTGEARTAPTPAMYTIVLTNVVLTTVLSWNAVRLGAIDLQRLPAGHFADIRQYNGSRHEPCG